jgi:hypothetical protein
MPTGVVNVKGFRTLIHTGGMLWGAQLGSACKSCNQSVLTSAQIEFAHPTGVFTRDERMARGASFRRRGDGALAAGRPDHTGNGPRPLGSPTRDCGKGQTSASFTEMVERARRELIDYNRIAARATAHRRPEQLMSAFGRLPGRQRASASRGEPLRRCRDLFAFEQMYGEIRPN